MPNRRSSTRASRTRFLATRSPIKLRQNVYGTAGICGMKQARKTEKTLTQILQRWSELGRRFDRVPLAVQPSWVHTRRMTAAAEALFRVRAARLEQLLLGSNEMLRPLADPLSLDFGGHRWLASGREQAYSDWRHPASKTTSGSTRAPQKLA